MQYFLHSLHTRDENGMQTLTNVCADLSSVFARKYSENLICVRWTALSQFLSELFSARETITWAKNFPVEIALHFKVPWLFECVVISYQTTFFSPASKAL